MKELRYGSDPGTPYGEAMVGGFRVLGTPEVQEAGQGHPACCGQGSRRSEAWGQGFAAALALLADPALQALEEAFYAEREDAGSSPLPARHACRVRRRRPRRQAGGRTVIVALAIIGALAVLLVCAVIADIFDCWPPVKGLARLKGATVEAIKQEGRE